jgi:hypothetical protein
MRRRIPRSTAACLYMPKLWRHLVATFAGRLMDTADPCTVRADLIGGAHRSLEPVHI